MPLTRHFYDSDDVIAALYYSSSRRDVKETQFWCTELLLSGYSSEAISVLFESWLFQRGPFYLRWLINAEILTKDNVTEDAILQAAVELSSYAEWDNSVWSILCSKQPADRVTPKTPPWISISSDSKCSHQVLYLYRAMYQGKGRSAWLMAQQIQDVWPILKEYSRHLSPDYEACFTILEKYEDLLGYHSASYSIAIKCCAVLMLCLSKEKMEQSLKMRQISFTPLQIPIGRKAARLYPIPSVISGHLVSQLYDVEKSIKGCPFWDDVNKKDIDAFYNTYFPDDIPDEWTAKDKEKSHRIHKVESTMIQHYALTKPCRLNWNTTNCGKNGLHPLDFIETSNGLHPSDVNETLDCQINTKPLRRKYLAH